MRYTTGVLGPHVSVSHHFCATVGSTHVGVSRRAGGRTRTYRTDPVYDRRSGCHTPRESYGPRTPPESVVTDTLTGSASRREFGREWMSITRDGPLVLPYRFLFHGPFTHTFSDHIVGSHTVRGLGPSESVPSGPRLSSTLIPSL